MRHATAWAAMALCMATPVLAGDRDASKDVVAFNASVRVEVDAAGKPVKVEAPADLPEAIRGYIEKRVASWQYQPAKAHGAPAAAVTYVRVGACAIPVAEGYRLGLDFKGNGPALETPGPWFLPPPQYPRDLQRRGAEGQFKVSYVVQKDGSTRVKSVVSLDGDGRRYAKEFIRALTDWIEDMRYRPEQVGGVAMETEMSFPVSFKIDGNSDGDWRKQYQKELQARAIASRECIAASMPGGPLPVASNSPVTVIPSPAG